MDKATLLARIRQGNDLVAVNVPEWETDVYLKPLTLAESMALLPLDNADRLLPMLAFSICDSSGQAIFDLHDLENLPANQLPILSRLAEAAADLVNQAAIEKK